MVGSCGPAADDGSARREAASCLWSLQIEKERRELNEREEERKSEKKGRKEGNKPSLETVPFWHLSLGLQSCFRFGSDTRVARSKCVFEF